jgi:hypothetical protein
LSGQKHASALDSVPLATTASGLQAKYTFSKWFQFQWMADEMVDIANGQASDCNPENFRRAKRQIAALQSRLSKLKPKKYHWNRDAQRQTATGPVVCVVDGPSRE